MNKTVFFKNNTRQLDFSKSKIMGVVNMTPDSFFDGGEYNQLDLAEKHCLKLEEEGADILDVGGESSRPGAIGISLEEELQRVIPLIKQIRKKSKILLSIDTRRSEVAEQAILAGADIINDISGFEFDKNMIAIIKKYDVMAIAMHMRGTPETMQVNIDYNDLISDINAYFSKILNSLAKQKIETSRVILDPGIGFSKDAEQNIKILKSLEEFYIHGNPLLVGHSQKSFIGHILAEKNPVKRLWGTCAISYYLLQKKCSIIRVHDVKALYDLTRVFEVLE